MLCNEIRRCGLSEDNIQDFLSIERPGVSEHGLIAAIVLRIVNVQGEVLVDEGHYQK